MAVCHRVTPKLEHSAVLNEYISYAQEQRRRFD